MSRLLSLVLIVAVMIGGGAPADAQTFDWSKVSPVEKLMARRAARLDALRELGELVKSLPIGSGRTLSDLRPDVSVFLTGAAELGQPKYLPTGYCKLTMSLPARVILASAASLAKQRGVGLDMAALRTALGVSLEATGLGRARSAAQGEAPLRGKRQGHLIEPKRRMAQRDDQEPRSTERRMRKLLEESDRFSRDERSEKWRREWQRQSEDWERTWRRDAEQWRRKMNQWNADHDRWSRRFSTMSIGEQWEKGRPIGGGWRLLPDGSMIRLLSEKVMPQPAVRSGKRSAPRGGEQVIEETITEEVIEQRILVK